MKDRDLFRTGDKSKACPKCGGLLTLRQGCYHWRGTDYSGWVCEPCNALWASLDYAFEEVTGMEKRNLGSQKEKTDG